MFMVILVVAPRRFMMEQKFQQPPRKQQQLEFPGPISHGPQPADGNIIILTKYFALCMNIQRASVAFSLKDWHVLYCPRTSVWCFRVLPWCSGAEFTQACHFWHSWREPCSVRLSLRHNLLWRFNKASKC